MIAGLISNKKFSSIVSDEFIRERKLNLSTAFIINSCFQVPKNVGLKSTHFLLRIFQRNIRQILVLKTL